MDKTKFNAELDKLIIEKFGVDMKKLQKRMEQDLYSDVFGATIPSPTDITMQICSKCGVIHLGQCEPKELATNLTR